MDLKNSKILAVFLIVCFFHSVCYSQRKSHTADYYFQQANIKSEVPPGYFNDSLAKACIVLYSNAIKLNSKFSKAYRNRGRLYAYLKLYKNAINDLTKAVKYCDRGEKWSLCVIRGEYYYLTGNYAHAIKDYNVAIPVDGNPAYLYLLRAKSYWKLGMKDKACKDYSNALRLNPEVIKDKDFLNCKKPC